MRAKTRGKRGQGTATEEEKARKAARRKERAKARAQEEAALEIFYAWALETFLEAFKALQENAEAPSLATGDEEFDATRARIRATIKEREEASQAPPKYRH